MKALNEHFPKQWIGRGRSKTMPPQSLDINVQEIYLWGYTKQRTYM